MNLTMDDRLEILNLCTRYSFAADSGDPSQFVQCFSDDGVFAPDTVRLQGPEQLETASARFSQLQKELDIQVRHWAAPPLLDVADGQPVGRQYWMLVRCPTTSRLPELITTGVYDDTFIKTKHGWRFKERRSTSDGGMSLALALDLEQQGG